MMMMMMMTTTTTAAAMMMMMMMMMMTASKMNSIYIYIDILAAALWKEPFTGAFRK